MKNLKYNFIIVISVTLLCLNSLKAQQYSKIVYSSTNNNGTTSYDKQMFVYSFPTEFYSNKKNNPKNGFKVQFYLDISQIKNRLATRVGSLIYTDEGSKKLKALINLYAKYGGYNTSYGSHIIHFYFTRRYKDKDVYLTPWGKSTVTLIPRNGSQTYTLSLEIDNYALKISAKSIDRSYCDFSYDGFYDSDLRRKLISAYESKRLYLLLDSRLGPTRSLHFTSNNKPVRANSTNFYPPITTLSTFSASNNESSIITSDTCDCNTLPVDNSEDGFIEDVDIDDNIESSIEDSSIYRIVSRIVPSSVELKNNYNGTDVNITANTDKANQYWMALQIDSTYWTFKNIFSGKLLEVGGKSLVNGGAVQGYSDQNHDFQKWRIVEIDSIHYVIVNKGSGKALQIPNSNTANGTYLNQWTLTNLHNQQWSFEKISDDETPDNQTPIGNVDQVVVNNLITGWAKDDDCSDSTVTLHVYVDGKFKDTCQTGAFVSDTSLVREDGFQWEVPSNMLDGKPHSIDVYAINYPIGTNPKIGSVFYQYQPCSLKPLTGYLAKDIATGGDSSWIIGTNNKLYRWVASKFISIDSILAASIAVDFTGNVWYIDNNSKINYGINGEFFKAPNGTGKKVACGADGIVAIIGTNNALYQWDGDSSWISLGGSANEYALEVAVDATGTVWHIGSGNIIYKLLPNNSFSRVSSILAKKIACGKDGSVFIIGMDNNLYVWDGDNSFYPVSSIKNIKYLAVNTANDIIAVDATSNTVLLGCDANASTNQQIMQTQVEQIDNTSPNIDLKIFPNPTTGIVNIQLPENMANGKIKVESVLGAVVATNNTNATNRTLNLSGKPKGIYVVKIITDAGKITTKKIVLQ